MRNLLSCLLILAVVSCGGSGSKTSPSKSEQPTSYSERGALSSMESGKTLRQSSPREVIETSFRYLEKGNYENFMRYCNDYDSASKSTRRNALKEINKRYESSDIKLVKIGKIDLSNNGNFAKAEVTARYKGEVSNDIVELSKDEHGRWRIVTDIFSKLK